MCNVSKCWIWGINQVQGDHHIPLPHNKEIKTLLDRVVLQIISSSLSNVIGCHWGPKQKLRTGYRVPSLKCTSCCDMLSLSSVVSCAFCALCVSSKFGHHPHPLGYPCAKFCFFCSLRCWASSITLFFVECGIMRCLYAMHIFEVRTLSSSLGYPCVKFHFFRSLHCWASPRRNIADSITQSIAHWLTQLIWCPGNWSFRFRIKILCDSAASKQT